MGACRFIHWSPPVFYFSFEISIACWLLSRPNWRIVSKLTTDVVTYCTEASNQKSKYAYQKIFFYKKALVICEWLPHDAVSKRLKFIRSVYNSTSPGLAKAQYVKRSSRLTLTMFEAGCRSMTRASPRSWMLLNRVSLACSSLVSCCTVIHSNQLTQPRQFISWEFTDSRSLLTATSYCCWQWNNTEHSS